MREETYDVFARKSRGEPLRHVGYLEALGDELARVYAWRTYDEENWFEMCVVRRSHIIPVNRDDGPFAAARRPPGEKAAVEDEEMSPAQPYGGDS
jgi:1,2-phenylacetyl-CoA epoxidase PaaB subunit